MLILAVTALPEGPEWLYEVKFDGYRARGIKPVGRVQLRSTAVRASGNLRPPHRR